jgi:hypothetical protein
LIADRLTDTESSKQEQHDTGSGRRRRQPLRHKSHVVGKVKRLNEKLILRIKKKREVDDHMDQDEQIHNSNEETGYSNGRKSPVKRANSSEAIQAKSPGKPRTNNR